MPQRTRTPARPPRPQETAVDERYSALLHELGTLENSPLLHGLDEVVGERLSEAEAYGRSQSVGRPVEERLAALEADSAQLRRVLGTVGTVLDPELLSAAVPESTPDPAPCACDFYGQNPDLHDELLGFEARGVAGVDWLIEYLCATEEMMPTPGQRPRLPWLEFGQFVAEHNWSNPLAVSRVAHEIDCLIRLRRPGPVGFTAARAPAPEVLQARRVEIVDGAGRARIVLDDGTGQAGGALDGPGVVLLDQEGNARARLDLDDRSGPRLDFSSAFGNVMLSASLVEEAGDQPHAYLHLAHPDGSMRTSLDQLAEDHAKLLGLAGADRRDLVQKRSARGGPAMTTRGQQPDVEVATAPTSRITHPERIPPIVAKRVPELLAEALELAKRAQGLVHDVNQVESTLALLSHDPGLGIETTTYDPVAERLEVLMDETGASAVSAVVYNTSLMLNDEGELLYELCERLGIERPDFGPPPRGPSGDTGGIAYSLTASVRPPAMPAPAPPPPRARAAR